MATHSEGRGLILVSDTHKLMTTPILVILFPGTDITVIFKG
jgi:hypothetical protein